MAMPSSMSASGGAAGPSTATSSNSFQMGGLNMSKTPVWAWAVLAIAFIAMALMSFA